MEVVSQVLQVEGPGAELLPVDPLKGHDAVQVATQLWSKGKTSLFSKPETPKCATFLSTGMTWTYLFGFTVLKPSLCVANVQVFGVLRVQVSHNVSPPLRKSPIITGSNKTDKYSWEGAGQDLLFTVDRRVFPTGLTNKDPVFHFIHSEGSP